MAGHSKWANIQHRKNRVDAQRGRVWSKLSKTIIVAAQMGGGDPAANFRLRKAIDDAKAASMPKDNIERAIKRGTGEIEGGRVEEVLYEGYGPGGVAVMVEAMTDNRNRTAPELRSLFGKYGGELGKTGCVAYLFDRKGLVVLEGTCDEETVTMLALENGADDIERNEDDNFQVTCAPDAHQQLSEALAATDLPIVFNEVTQLPQTTVDVEGTVAKQAMQLLEALDEHDDVQNVSTNLNVTDESVAE